MAASDGFVPLPPSWNLLQESVTTYFNAFLESMSTHVQNNKEENP